MKYIYTFLIAIILGASFNQAAAQESALMSFMRQSPQALRTNPAGLSDSVRWFMGIPFLFSHLGVDLDAGIAYGDVIRRNADNSLQINPKFADKIADARTLFHFNYELLSFGFRFQKKHMITFSTAVVADASFLLPGELATLIVKGNTPGQPLSITSEINAAAYVETALGYSFAVNKNWKAGLRVKYLQGGVNIFGKNLRATIATDPDDYKMTLTSDAQANMAYVDGLETAMDNSGVAFDAGIYYNTPVKGLSVSASMVDWGWIDWASNPKIYEAKMTGGKFEFAGLTSLDGDFNQIIDTLQNVFDFRDRAGKAYRAPLPGKIYVSATYGLTKNDKFGFLFSTRALDGFSRTTFTLMYNRSVGRWFSIAAGNNFMASKIFNPSIAFNLRGGAFQFYMAAENISSFNPARTRTLHLQFGINLTFLNKTPKKPKTDVETDSGQ
ncbi:MAG: DUF5723 family protein [Prevotellaceae bacterium]|jgi:hypothetical protein|nr:DUF5723 family protein [Prevotellaceae bacterium]